jgi:hypothetical protein
MYGLNWHSLQAHERGALPYAAARLAFSTLFMNVRRVFLQREPSLQSAACASCAALSLRSLRPLLTGLPLCELGRAGAQEPLAGRPRGHGRPHTRAGTSLDYSSF